MGNGADKAGVESPVTLIAELEHSRVGTRVDDSPRPVAASVVDENRSPVAARLCQQAFERHRKERRPIEDGDDKSHWR